jgi:hypothetical protein
MKMNKYQVLINVENIFLPVEGKPTLMGYYQTLKIEAETPEQAEIQAVEMIRNDEEIKSIWLREKQISPPIIFAEEINQVEEFDSDITGDRTGRLLYPVKRWWQFWK